jgi:hypothetical protein
MGTILVNKEASVGANMIDEPDVHLNSYDNVISQSIKLSQPKGHICVASWSADVESIQSQEQT